MFFDEPLGPGSVAGLQLTLDDVALEGSVVLGTASSSLRFTPASAFPVGTLVAVVVDNSVVDLLGNPLANADGTPAVDPIVTTFTTADFGIVADDTH